MQNFSYYRPTTLDEALRLIGEHDEPKVIAGGMTMLPTMKLRLAMPAHLIDLHQVSELKGITDCNDHVEIGAMSTHAEVAQSELVRHTIPALAELADNIGDAQVRNRGTLGGSIANNDPAADYPAALLGLGATVVTDRRSIPADEFFLDLFETALEENELVVKVAFPKIRLACYAKFANPASRYAIAGVMLVHTDEQLRFAVTGAGPCVYREKALETALGSRLDSSLIEGVEIDDSEFNEDLFASREYRAQLVKVLAKKAVDELAAKQKEQQ